MLLREYLYVDTTTVRGLLAQLENGVVETELESSSISKKSSAGIKGFADHSQDWGDARTTTKAMGDALFPALEAALETEDLIVDASDLISTREGWADQAMQTTLPAGRIVRITSPGYLIDSRFVAMTLSGFTTTHRGLVNMGIAPAVDEPVQPPRAKRASRSTKYRELPGEADSLEGMIPLGELRFDASESGSSLTGEFYRGIAQVARGMFSPGLHLVLLPDVEGAGAVTVRLQEGRQFLDTDPDIVFARYGVGAQEWTVVGSVGHHPLPSPSMTDGDFIQLDGTISRANFGRYINRLGTLLGNRGFTDLPQAPGFSVIPWAVYRTLGL